MYTKGEIKNTIRACYFKSGEDDPNGKVDRRIDDIAQWVYENINVLPQPVPEHELHQIHAYEVYWCSKHYLVHTWPNLDDNSYPENCSVCGQPLTRQGKPIVPPNPFKEAVDKLSAASIYGREIIEQYLRENFMPKGEGK